MGDWVGGGDGERGGKKGGGRKGGGRIVKGRGKRAKEREEGGL